MNADHSKPARWMQQRWSEAVNSYIADTGTVPLKRADVDLAAEIRGRHAVLVLVDLQKKYVANTSEIPPDLFSPEEIRRWQARSRLIAREIVELIPAAEGKLPLLHVRYIPPDEHKGIHEPHPIVWHQSLIRGINGPRDFAYTVPEHHLVFTKECPSAFRKSPLAAFLRKKGWRTPILVGGYGSQCVLDTANDGVKADFNMVVVPELVMNRITADSPDRAERLGIMSRALSRFAQTAALQELKNALAPAALQPGFGRRTAAPA